MYSRGKSRIARIMYQEYRGEPLEIQMFPELIEYSSGRSGALNLCELLTEFAHAEEEKL